MDRLQAMTIFVAVAEEASFAGGARRLRLSPPAVTRAVAAGVRAWRLMSCIAALSAKRSRGKVSVRKLMRTSPTRSARRLVFDCWLARSVDTCIDVPPESIGRAAMPPAVIPPTSARVRSVAEA